jgi:site-specific recombinase XerD
MPAATILDLATRKARSQIAADHDFYTLDMQSRNLSPRTVETYSEAIRQFEAFQASHGATTDTSEVTRGDVQAFVRDQLSRYRATSVQTRYASLRAFFSWALREEIVEKSPMAGMRQPSAPEEYRPVPTDDEVSALLAACAGRSLACRRHEAMVRVLIDTGARRQEVGSLTLDDVSLEQHFIVIRRGKGGKSRVVPFGAKTGVALSRYLRLRKTSRFADSPSLWVSQMGPMTFRAVNSVLEDRCAKAGIRRIGPHAFRHLWAHETMASGMAEGDVVTLGGWSDATMLQQRYGKSLSAERALASYKSRPSPGDRF